MATTPPALTSEQKYQREFSTYARSGCGVMFTKTREPYRAIEALKLQALGGQKQFHLWDVVFGWRTYAENVDEAAKTTSILDPFPALKRVCDVDAGGNDPLVGVCVMHAVHPWLGKDPRLTELLRQYSRMLCEERWNAVRLVIVLPDGAVIPDELHNDLPVLSFALPGASEVRGMLSHVIDGADVEPGTTLFSSTEENTLIASAAGMTQVEIELAFSLALVEGRQQFGSFEDIPFSFANRRVLEAKTEAVKRSEVLELMKPVDMVEVGGLDIIKQWVQDAAVTFTDEARRFGVAQAKGITAVGPPGCGKTLFAKAVATSLGQPLVKFDIARCFSGIVGSSETKTAQALAMLSAMGRCVILFDEVDKGLGGAHTNNDSGVSKKVLQLILTWLQETEAPIFPIFTANRPESLPAELMRKERVDAVFGIMPPNRVEREAVMSIHLAKMGHPLQPWELDGAVARSRGYISAELVSAVKSAVLQAFIRKIPVGGMLIEEALAGMQPLSVSYAEDFAAMSEWALKNAKLASSPIEEQEGTPTRVARPTVTERPRRRSLTA